jgi:hypothetical protein
MWPHHKQYVMVSFSVLTNIWNAASRSAFGEGTCCKMESSNGDMFFCIIKGAFGER